MADRVFRSVLKYIDYVTMEEYYWYSKPYAGDEGGRYANRAATVKKNQGKIGNQYITVPNTNTGWGNRNEYTTWFEYAERWLEEVEVWKRV